MAKLFPASFESYMHQRLGDAYSTFEAAHHHEPPVSIRLNPFKSPDGIADQIPWSACGRYLAKRPVFTFDPLWHAGAYYVQEASSMFLEQALKQIDLQQISYALDLCAAPGGKSTHLISLLPSDTLVISNEVIRSRSSILAENMVKWGYPNSIITSNDPTDFSSLTGLLDLVIVDAPCSGEGLFRKNRAAMKEWSPNNVALCAGRQLRILSNIWPALAEDGYLIYCTCTYNSTENEHNLEEFCAKHQTEFIEIPIEKEWGVEEVRHKSVIGYRFYPHLVKGEGFFLSLLRKKGKLSGKRGEKSTSLKPIQNKYFDIISSWIQSEYHHQYFERDDCIIALPEPVKSKAQVILDQLRVVSAGLKVGTIKQNKIVPDHALALSVLLSDHHISIELDKEQSLKYLRKEAIDVQVDHKGFVIVKFSGNAIGWINSLENRSNNLYPSTWRIRKQSSQQNIAD